MTAESWSSLVLEHIFKFKPFYGSFTHQVKLFLQLSLSEASPLCQKSNITWASSTANWFGPASHLSILFLH
jgi:hypothetical protein